MTIYLQDEAASDLESASSWYERQTVGLGNTFLDEVLSAFDRYADRFPFCVFFRYDTDRIQVFAVIHAIQALGNPGSNRPPNKSLKLTLEPVTSLTNALRASSAPEPPRSLNLSCVPNARLDG